MNDASRYGCVDAKSAARRWLSAKLPAEQVRELQTHLRKCAGCHEFFLAASASQFFSGQDVRRDAAYQAAGLAVDEVGLVRPNSTRQNQPVNDVKPAEHVLLLTDGGSPVVSSGSQMPTSRNDLPFAFSKCESVHELLRQLLPISRELGLRNLRYHYFSERDARLASVDCVGHRAEIDRRVRREAVVRFLSPPLFAESDSYECFNLGRPVIFKAVQGINGLVRCGELEGLPVYQVQIERCERTQIAPCDAWWVDVPLATMGRFCGKLSCDLAAQSLDAISPHATYEFWRVAQLAAPFLEATYAQGVQSAFDAARDEINAIDDCDALHDYLTSGLPCQVFGCRHASLFTTSSDSDARRLLILRKSNLPSLRRWEHRAAYNPSDLQFVLPWVHQNRTSIRFSHLDSREHRQQQMLAYGKELAWQDPIIDWDAMHSTLATALHHPNGAPLGVLQLLNKRSQRGQTCAFTDYDARLVEKLAAEVIGPKLHSLAVPPAASRLDAYLEWGSQLCGLLKSETGQLIDRAASLLQEAMPESKGRKLYMVCKLTGINHQMSMLAMRGKLKRHSYEPTNYQLDHTITARAIQEPDRAVFWNQLPRDACARRSHVVTPRAVCALACSITLHSTPIGALVVKSDHYDLSPDSQGPLIERIARIVGEALGR